jgi:mRNA interferase MazF
MTKSNIVLVPFPFDDLRSNKVRPAVCLTNPIGPHRHVVVAFITSRLPAQPLPTDLIIDEADPAFSTTGLRVSSAVQFHRMLTISTALIQRRLGMLPSEWQVKVDQRLRLVFELQ